MDRAGAAEKPLLESYGALEAATGAASTETQYAVRKLVKAYERLGRGADASAWRARLR
jgi:hypothetical protein